MKQKRKLELVTHPVKNVDGLDGCTGEISNIRRSKDLMKAFNCAHWSHTAYVLLCWWRKVAFAHKRQRMVACILACFVPLFAVIVWSRVFFQEESSFVSLAMRMAIVLKSM